MCHWIAIIYTPEEDHHEIDLTVHIDENELVKCTKSASVLKLFYC
jgi:hypothetical protein